MTITDTQVRELAEALRGSCTTLEYALQEMDAVLDDMTKTTCLLLDNLVLLCAGCDWWCDAGEMKETDGEYYCTDCAD